MRIDKYLWCVRIFKTRGLATEACKKNHVSINNQKVKPSKEVFGSEKIGIRKNQIDYQFEVLDLPTRRVGAKLVGLYYNDTTPKEAFKKDEMLKFSKDYYRKKGEGRPTKKDRRDIENYTDED
ncbi:MAG: RNA-binding S4 domain-containing protein [Flavobacteriaceae bacterium]|nr:RNA-binding S4 domain-containing protein [Flavobacteriaceae bacterium]